MTDSTPTPDLPVDEPRPWIRRGRPYSTSTPLGQAMFARTLQVHDVERATGISHRTLSNYLAGRSEISVVHLIALSDLLRVDARTLRGAAPPKPTPRADAGNGWQGPATDDGWPDGRAILAAIQEQMSRRDAGNR